MFCNATDKQEYCSLGVLVYLTLRQVGLISYITSKHARFTKKILTYTCSMFATFRDPPIDIMHVNMHVIGRYSHGGSCCRTCSL